MGIIFINNSKTMRIRYLSCILFIIYLLSSCSLEHTITGTYVPRQRGKSPKRIPTTFRITLDADNHFTYLYRAGFKKEYSEGTWLSITKDTLLLNSQLQDIHSIPLIIERGEHRDNDSIVFLFNNSLKDTSVINWTIEVNDVPYEFNQDSLVLQMGDSCNFFVRGTIPLEVDSLIVPYLLNTKLESCSYSIGRSKGTRIVISFPHYITWDVVYYLPITERIRVKNKKLIIDEGIITKKRIVLYKKSD